MVEQVPVSDKSPLVEVMAVWLCGIVESVNATVTSGGVSHVCHACLGSVSVSVNVRETDGGIENREIWSGSGIAAFADFASLVSETAVQRRDQRKKYFGGGGGSDGDDVSFSGETLCRPWYNVRSKHMDH